MPNKHEISCCISNYSVLKSCILSILRNTIRRGNIFNIINILTVELNKIQQ
jgi:hypothetical protein